MPESTPKDGKPEPMTADLIRRLRDRAQQFRDLAAALKAKHLVPDAAAKDSNALLLEQAADAIESLQRRIGELEGRLEIDHAWQFMNGEKVRVEIPPEERDRFPDGIECRNETIRLQDKNIETLRANVATLQSQLSLARRMALDEAAAIVRGQVYKEHYRTYPQYHRNGGNMSNDAEAVNLCDCLADAIMALSPVVDIDAMVTAQMRETGTG
jgi:hypothetical protein